MKVQKEKFEKTGLPGQLYLKKKLWLLKYVEKQPLQIFIAEFDEIDRQLTFAKIN